MHPSRYCVSKVLRRRENQCQWSVAINPLWGERAATLYYKYIRKSSAVHWKTDQGIKSCVCAEVSVLLATKNSYLEC